MKQKIDGFDVILLALSAVLLLGVLTVFAPCGAKEDGSWMTCHWAGNAVAGAAAVLTALPRGHVARSDGAVHPDHRLRGDGYRISAQERLNDELRERTLS